MLVFYAVISNYEDSGQRNMFIGNQFACRNQASQTVTLASPTRQRPTAN